MSDPKGFIVRVFDAYDHDEFVDIDCRGSYYPNLRQSIIEFAAEKASPLFMFRQDGTLKELIRLVVKGHYVEVKTTQKITFEAKECGRTPYLKAGNLKAVEVGSE